jgi:hypothetical protein
LTFLPTYGKINPVSKSLAKLQTKEAIMAKKIKAPTVGSQFITSVSKVSGVVQEVIENKNGSYRVRLDVDGQDRWTTVK